MTAADVRIRWRRFRRTARQRFARFTPDVVTRLPFEVLVIVLGMVAGLPLLLGLTVPGSLALLLPTIWFHLYAVMVVLGAALTAAGVSTKNSLITANGLNLAGWAWVIYGVAVLVLAGWTVAWLSFSAFVLLGLLALLRGTHYRRSVDIRTATTQQTAGWPEDAR